jgi:hypothetical protein
MDPGNQDVMSPFHPRFRFWAGQSPLQTLESLVRGLNLVFSLGYAWVWSTSTFV